MSEPNVPSEPDPREELVQDDAIIGRAFRWSLVVFLAVGAGIGLVVLLLRRAPLPEPDPPPPYVPPRAAPDDVRPPSVLFVDVTREAGIAFERENGATGSKYLPETLGGGCAFLDHDGDGDPDLFLANGAPWPEDVEAGAELPTSALYENDGAGRFEDRSAEAGLDLTAQAMGCAVGDVDGDGDPDLYVTAVGPNLLLRNDGGVFEDVSADSGAQGPADAWSTSAAFFDADLDGDLDLFACRYVEWSPEIEAEVDYRLVGVGRAYGPPLNYAGTQSSFFVNRGDGTFEDATERAGLTVLNEATGGAVGKALGVAPVDVDGDGSIDLAVANDTVRNFLYLNAGDGTFEEQGSWLGFAYGPDGNATGAMGIDVSDFRNDGSLGIAIGNFANEMTSLFVASSERLLFTDEAIVEGVGAPSRGALSFGLLFLDYDLDGRADLLQANGHLEEEIGRVQASQTYRQPAQLFWNAGDSGARTYYEVPLATTGDLGRPIVGRGAAYADIDADGDLDVLLTQPRGAPLLLRNDQLSDHRWVRVRLRGDTANRDGLGAWVELTAGGRVQRAVMATSRGYLSSVEPMLTFGLGESESVESLRVRWPGGEVQELTDVEVGSTVLVEQ